MRFWMWCLFVVFGVTSVAWADKPVTFLRTMAAPETSIEGLETAFVSVRVDGGARLGALPPMQADLSQGSETGDPNFYEEMEPFVCELKPRLVRVDPFSNVSQALSLDDDGQLQMNFAAADRIVASLRRCGAEICWNCASWPKEWNDGYPKNMERWASYIRQVVEHYNGDGERDIHYIEFWNEPAGFDAKVYDVLAKVARSVDPEIKVGAPATMDLKIKAIEDAVRHCHETSVPIDFISFHFYYKPPWEWPELIGKAQAVLDKYPGMEKLEMLVTEWGIDAGESGSCDTRFNAAYYCSVLERMMPYYPQVRPTHFELREGWDWKGPSRDLFGRWGMLTYTNLLPKPVFQAARMWAMMAGERVACSTSDERIRAIASVEPGKTTILLWSYPKQYQRMQANDTEHGPSVMDIPVQIDVRNLPFDSPGLSYERYALDALHSNVTTDWGRSALEKVQQVVLARESRAAGSADTDFRVQTVMPLHGVSLIVLRPAERAPADLEATPDRYQIWGGQSAEITIVPKFGETFPIEVLPDTGTLDRFDVEVVGQDPTRIRVTPLKPDVRAQQFFTAWVKRSDWGALARVLCEFRTDIPLRVERESWRADLSAVTRTGTVEIPLKNIAQEDVEVVVAWRPDAPLRVTSSDNAVTLAANSVESVTAQLALPKDATPGKYTIHTTPNTGLDLEPIETSIYLPFASYRTDTPPVFDGKLDEWRDQQPMVLNDKALWGGHHTTSWDGPKDLSGKVWSRWDDKCLYFAFEIIDDQHITHVGNREMSKYDLIHMGFDLRRDAFDKSAFFVEDDCDYGIALLDKGVAYRFWGARRAEETPKEMIVGARRVGDVTTYEVSFPWKAEFEPYASPKVGSVIGMTIMLRDVDGEEKQSFLRFGEGLRWHSKRPALFNSLELVE